MALNFGLRIQQQTYRRYYHNVLAYYRRPAVHLYLNAVLSLFAIAFFGWFALRPTAKTITSLIKEIEEYRQINQKLDSKIQSLSRAQAAFLQAKPYFPLLDQALPAAPESAVFLRQIEVLAFQHSVALSALSIDSVVLKTTGADTVNKEKTDSKEGLLKDKTLKFSVSCQGNYQNVKAFLNELERLIRFVHLSKVSLAKDSDSGGSSGPDVIVAVRGEIYYQAE